ncbi:ATP-binding cassette sub-family A member 7 [Biomphalaria glabrata]
MVGGLSLIRSGIPVVKFNDCYYQARAMPSAGLVPFLQTFLCNLDNHCYAKEERHNQAEYNSKNFALVAQDLGQIFASNETLYLLEISNNSNGLISLVQNIIQNQIVFEKLENMTYIKYYLRDLSQVTNILVNEFKVLTFEETKDILMAKLNFSKLLNWSSFSNLKNVTCDPSQLQSYILFPANASIVDISESLCVLNTSEATQLLYKIVPHLNLTSLVQLVQYIEEMKERFISTSHLSSVLDDVAQMTEILMTSEPVFRALEKLAGVYSVLQEVKTLSSWIGMFSSLTDVVPRIKSFMLGVKPLMIVAGLDNSTLWSVLQDIIKLGENINQLKEGNWTLSAQTFMEPVTALVQNINLLSSDIGGQTTFLLLDYLTKISDEIKKNNSLLSQGMIDSTKFLQETLEKQQNWPSIQVAANVINQGLELTNTIANTLFDIKQTLQTLTDIYVNSLSQISNKYPLVILSLVETVLDPTFSLASLVNGSGFNSACSKLFNKLSVIMNINEVKSLGGILCGNSPLEAVLNLTSNFPLTDLINKINETVNKLTPLSNGTVSDQAANLTSIYLLLSKVLTTFKLITTSNNNQTGNNILNSIITTNILPVDMLTSVKEIVSFFQLPATQLLLKDPDLAILFDFAFNFISTPNKGSLTVSQLFQTNANITLYLTNILGLPSSVVYSFINARIGNNRTNIFQQSVPGIVGILCDSTYLSTIITLPVNSSVSVTNISSYLCNMKVYQTAEYLRNSSQNSTIVSSLIFQATVDDLTALVTSSVQMFTQFSDVITFLINLLQNINSNILKDNTDVLDKLLVNNTFTDMSKSVQLIVNILAKNKPLSSNINQVVSGLQKVANGLSALDVIKEYFLKEIEVKNLIKTADNMTNYFMTNFGLSGETTQTLLQAIFSSSSLLGNINSSQHLCSDVMKRLLFINATQSSIQRFASEVCALNSTKLAELFNLLTIQLDVQALVKTYFSKISQSVLEANNLTSDHLLEQVKLIGSGMTNLINAYDTLTKSQSENEIIKNLADAASSGQLNKEQLTRSLCGRTSDDIFAFPPTPGVSFSSQESLLSKFQQETSQDIENELPGEFCVDFYRLIKNSELGTIIWSFVKPLLIGRILYTPDNEITRTILARANHTFAVLERVKEIASVWANKTSNLNSLMKLASDAKDLVSLDLFQQIIQATTGVQWNALMSKYLGNQTTFKDSYFSILQSTAKIILNYSSCVQTNRFQPVLNENDLENTAYKLSRTNMFFAGIVFFNVSDDNTSSSNKRRRDVHKESVPKHVGYKIRMDIDNVMNTRHLKLPIEYMNSESNFLEDLRYLRGFIYLQDMLDTAIVDLFKDERLTTPGTYIKQIPFPCHHLDSLIHIIGSYFAPIMLVVVFVALLAIATNILVYDKEDGQEETLHVMGMMKGLNTIAWFISSMVIMSINSLLIAVILKYTNVFFHADLFILFLLVLVFCFSSVLLVYMVSAFFTHSSMAILFVLITFLLTFLPYTLVIGMELVMKFEHRILVSLVSTTAFCFAFLRLGYIEGTGEGAQWSNIDQALEENMSINWSFFMMLIDSGIYFLVGFYVRNVKPGKYGVGRSWYFPFQLSYWKSWFMYNKPNNNMLNLHPVTTGPLFEPPPSHATVGIALENIRKMYSRKRVALENLSVSFYKDQITTLLGPNGAAKTTTIKIICGLLPPSSGKVGIYGLEPGAMYNFLGICPQHNALFNYMTVTDHMKFYFIIKSGKSRQQADTEISRLLKDVDLWHARNVPVKDLSFGMKRRLCVALAFVGGSKTIILDEPTSGVDPYARKQIWNLITKNRSGRTILLTTHHLDEADFLSDRIAVLHQGNLICYGSPSFIKWSVGGSYRLTLIKQEHNSPTHVNDNKDSNNMNSRIMNSTITSFVQSLCPKAALVEHVGTDLTFHLPKDPKELTVPFDQFFRQLDQSLDHLKINTYGLSDTSLEEVFLKLTKSVDDTVEDSIDQSRLYVDSGASAASSSTEEHEHSETGSDNSLTSYFAHVRKQGLSLLLAQVIALLLKRFHHYRRNWRIILSAILLPLLFFLVAIGMASVRYADQNPPTLVLDPSTYGPKSYSFFKDSAGNEMSRKYFETMVNSNIGFGTACMKGQQRNPVCVGNSSWYNHSQKLYVPQCVDANQVLLDLPFVYTINEKHIQADNYILNINSFGFDFKLPPYLMMTFKEYMGKRFGGWSLEASRNNGSVTPYAWFSSKGYHAMPCYFNSLSNMVLRSMLPDGENLEEYGITAATHPLRLSRPALTATDLQGDAVDGGLSIVVVLAFSFIPCSFILYIINEKVMKERQLQNISGIGVITYWAVALFWDMLIYCFTLGLAVALVLILKADSFYIEDNLSGFVLIVLLYGWANIPCLYCLSRFFTKGSTAYLVTLCINVFLVTVTIISLFIMLLYRDISTARVLYDWCKYIFLIFPQYALGQGLIDMTANTYAYKLIIRYNDVKYESPFSADILGWKLLALAIEGFIFFILNICLDALKSPKLSIPSRDNLSQEDEDVKREKERILSGSANDLLIVSDLSKVYRRNGKDFMAVNHISFGVPEGKCFGLLGVNGAGKTTTFRMLTGDLRAESGTVTIKGRSLTQREGNFGQNVGYCPQEGGLDEYLTAEEMLYFHARLRGFNMEQTKILVPDLLEQLALTQYKNNAVHTYSGGTKRKLSLAIALLGNPSILFLDEPTTGMDAATRRLAWKCLARAKRNGQSVILTSHSMDECDALCSVIAIMVNGQMKCIGSPQHLKYKFGDGYTVIMHSGKSNLKDIVSDFVTRFPGTIIKANHHSSVELHVPKHSCFIADILAALQTAQKDEIIGYYSLTQTTLDSVFISFAQNQSETFQEQVITRTSSIEDASDSLVDTLSTSSGYSKSPPLKNITEGSPVVENPYIKENLLFAPAISYNQRNYIVNIQLQAKPDVKA